MKLINRIRKGIYKRGSILKLDDLMRMLAKKAMCQSIWRISRESNISFFNGKVMEWTPAQKLLASWCLFYDGVKSGYESPPDRIVNDNEKLEEWLKVKKKERELREEEDYQKGRVHVPSKGKIKSAWDHEEVFTFDEE